ncbi:hypothetical protein B484DRAFT_407620, partial [Ochromonadaceae sp. CCMP2298]
TYIRSVSNSTSADTCARPPTATYIRSQTGEQQHQRRPLRSPPYSHLQQTGERQHQRRPLRSPPYSPTEER